jgi:hypothetical protein
MCRRTCEGVISQHRCYIRKPGPRSEEPFTAEEWRGLLERCVHARRESMLDAIRTIVHGHVVATSPAASDSALATFGEIAISRWQELIADLPADDVARMPHGHYEIEIELVGVVNSGGVADTLRRLAEASRIKHTGWGPFVQLNRAEFTPRPVDGHVEAWIGRPVADRALRDAAHSDFWRVSPNGMMFLLRGYDEDASDRVQPGTIIDITLPIWRVAEAMLFASRFARALDGGDPDIVVRCRYTGLQNRRLDCLTPGRHLSMEYTCHDPRAVVQAEATATQMDDNLVEVVHTMLAPLYERFSFFQLSRELVRTEIEKMRGSRF